MNNASEKSNCLLRRRSLIMESLRPSFARWGDWGTSRLRMYLRGVLGQCTGLRLQNILRVRSLFSSGILLQT